ncbi:hypothetical protein [Streptomyces lydicus]|uniref:hypothetical protein n=1 Tax=Streptomyces lydicus TaxID=47763 RepID=UPI000523F1D6|nr:hypothetical protein [Streptomyces lydicus]UEG93060.1 hypothetical protein LJ741_22410 [Streptomyces lydicus]
MAINPDDLRKALTDATPLYALAGTVDLAAEKLGEVPQIVEKIRTEAPKRFESVRSTDPKDVQALVTKQAKDAQEKLGELLESLDGDFKKFRDQAQELALQGVGRVAETAVRAREGYEELAERGRGAVATWRGEMAERTEDVAVAIEPDPAPKPASKPTPRTGAANGAKTQTKSAPVTPAKPAAAKKPVAQRKPAPGPAKKSTPPSAK